MTAHELLAYFFALFAITNPFGSLAIFLSLTKEKTLAEQRAIGHKTALSVGIILLIVTWLGQAILAFFGISIGAFQMAGGLVILLMGLSMLRTEKSRLSHTPEEHADAKAKESIAVVPLAIPIISGPGALTTVIIATHHYPAMADKLILSLGGLAIAVVIAVLLAFAKPISRLLGVSGLNIATRVMGLILMSMAVDMLADGVKRLFLS